MGKEKTETEMLVKIIEIQQILFEDLVMLSTRNKSIF